jgi:hypothetical protein
VAVAPSVAPAPAPAANRAEPPWWASLPPEEVAVRREDFDYMYGQPGAFPEFSEIVRQLSDAGVPMDIVRMESREIFGALLQRRTYALASADMHGSAARADSEGSAQGQRILAAALADKAAVAEAEVRGRLTNNGVELDSTAATRILQLYPTAPLRQLAAGSAAGAGP